MEPKISLILLAYNDEKTIEAALESIANQDILGKGLPLELIFTPNGCTDKTQERFDNFVEKNISKLQHVQTVNLSLAEGHRTKALNAAISKSKGDIVMYMNADCDISPNTLSEIYNAFLGNNNLYLAGPNDLPHLDHIDKSSLLFKMFEGEGILTDIKGKYLPIGRFTAFRKGLVDSFPEDIHSEDIWLGLQCFKKYGLESMKVLMSASVFWTPPNNWPDYIKLYTRYVYGPKQLIDKHPDMKTLWDDLLKLANKYTKEDLIKKVAESLMAKGLSEKEVTSYIQSYSTVRDIINENVELASRQLIGNDGTWAVDR